MSTIKNIIILVTISLFFACGKEEHTPYNHPFIHIMKNEMSTENVSTIADYTGEYKVLLSSKPLDEILNVEYSITAGDGLKEGVDYALISPNQSLKFLPGIYEMPIRIKWMPHKVDESKDNSLTIQLIDNSMNFTVGLPGKDQHQRSFIIYKKN